MMLNKMRTSNQKTKFCRVLRFLDGLMGALLISLSTLLIGLSPSIPMLLFLFDYNHDIV
jgi:hypothetical protein